MILWMLSGLSFAHPEEWWPLFLVSAGIIAGGYALLRIIFVGERRGLVEALPAKAYKKIMVPFCESVPEEGFLRDAVPVACGLCGADGGATVVLTHIIEVPRSLALTTTMPEEEAEAKRVLDAGIAVAKQRGVAVEVQIRKARSFADETIKAAQEMGADVLVYLTAEEGLAICGGPETIADLEETNEDSASNATVTMLRRAPCEVVFVRSAIRQHSVPSWS